MRETDSPHQTYSNENTYISHLSLDKLTYVKRVVPRIEDIDQESEFQLFMETYQLVEPLIKERDVVVTKISTYEFDKGVDRDVMYAKYNLDYLIVMSRIFIKSMSKSLKFVKVMHLC